MFKLFRKTFFTVAALFVLISEGVFAQTVTAKPNEFPLELAQKLNEKVAELHKVNNLYGISVAVRLLDESQWLGITGVNSAAPGDTLNKNLLFCFASNTKMFTAATTLLLFEEDKLSLDDSLHKWLPQFPNIDSTITVRQLLNHKSGLFDFLSNDSYWEAVNTEIEKAWEPEDVLKYIKAPLAKPGEKWNYCNTNYILLGMIIEKVTQQDLADVFRERLFEPFGMKHTCLATKDSLIGEMAHNWRDVDDKGHYVDLGVYNLKSLWTSSWAAGGAFSTAEDMANWAMQLFKNKLFHIDTFKEMTTFTPITLAPYYDGYGLGVFRQTMYDVMLWGHGGGTPGFNSEVIFSPEYRFSIALVMNQDGKNPVPLIKEILKVVLDYNTTKLEKEKTEKPSKFGLYQNYPNPFNAATTIEYYLPENGNVELKIANILGEEVKTLEAGEYPAGFHKTSWDGTNNSDDSMTSGIYFCQLKTEQEVLTKRLLFLK